MTVGFTVLISRDNDVEFQLYDCPESDPTALVWFHQEETLLSSPASPVSCIAYSPDGKWQGTAANSPRVFLREAATSKVIRAADLGAARPPPSK
jgi:WD40 repeat protein